MTNEPGDSEVPTPNTTGSSSMNSSQEAEAILDAGLFMAARQRRLKMERSFSPGAKTDDDDDGVGDNDSGDDDVSRSRSGESTPMNTSRRSSSTINQNTMRRIPTAETMSNAVINVLCLSLSVLAFGIFLVGSYDYFKNVEENKCALTWMYKYPFYAPVKIGSGVDEKFPMYGLYSYAEGEQNLKAVTREGYRYTGIPVLFIPGNAGSYQQVRSLASVALWKHIDAETPFHFDFFTVNLNEEFSAIYGYALNSQVEYVRHALMKIVNLYEDFHRVVLIGHSMGGVIAKSVALDENGDFGASLSNLVYTLATPHSNPVFILDPELDMFYFSVKKNWTKLRETEAELDTQGKVALVSIAGGDRDQLVQPRLTRWPPFTDVLAMTTGVPGVWASTDHLCIVWCVQFVLTVVRSLFDLVEIHPRNKYYRITDNDESRRAILNYHFVERTSGKSYFTRPKQNGGSAISLSTNLDQIEVTTGLYCHAGGKKGTYVLFPTSFLQSNLTSAQPMDDARVIVLTTNTKDRNWIMGCVEFKNGLCYHAENLAYLGKIIPHIRRRRKMARLELASLISKYSHIIVKMDTHPVKSCVMLETYSESQRTLPFAGGELKISNGIFYNLTMQRSPHSTSTLGGLIYNLMAWKIEARPGAVGNQSCPEAHNLLGTFKHGNFEQNRFLKNESLIVRFSDWNQSTASIELYLEPTCNYTITSSFAPVETAGQLFRLLTRFLPSFFASVILMTLYYQKDAENWSSFHIILLSNAYHLSIFPGFLIAVILYFVPTDWPHMVEASEYSVVLPIVLYMTAYCLVLGVSSGVWYTIITGGTALHSVIVRVLSTRFGSWVPRLLSNHRGFTSVTEHVTEAAFEITLTRFPLTIAVLLLGLSFVTCGSLGIALCVVLYLVKLFKMYEDLLEDLLKAKIANVKDSLSPMNFHFCCFMLWLVVGALNVPSLIHWSRSASLNSMSAAQPQWDLSMYLCLLLLPTVAILWQDFVPKMDPNLWNVHRYAFFGMGLACVLWGTHRLYVTAFLIVFNFLTLATCQLLSVMMNTLMREQPRQESTSTSSAAASPPPPTSPPSSTSEDRQTQTAQSPGTSSTSAPATASTSKTSSVKSTVSKEDLEKES